MTDKTEKDHNDGLKVEDLMKKNALDRDEYENKDKNKVDNDDVEEKKNEEVGNKVENTQADLEAEEKKIKTQTETKEELSVFSLITRTELLIDKFKELKREANKLSDNKEDKGVEKEHKAQIQNRIRRLEQVKKFLERYEKKSDHLSEKSLARYDRELLGFQNDIDKFEERRDFIVLEKASGLTPYQLDIHTFKDAKKLRNAYDRTNEMLRQLNALDLDVDLRKELRDELEGLKKYLESSLNGVVDPGKEPFKMKHREDFKQLGIIDPVLSNYVIPETTYLDPNNIDSNTPIRIGNQPNYIVGPDGKTICRPLKDYANLKEAGAQGGLKGLIDYGFQQTKMTGNQRQFRGGAVNLAMIGGGIFLGRKAISSILGFDKNKGKDRRKRIGGIAGASLLVPMLTGKNLFPAIKELTNGGDLSQRIADLFGGGKNNVNGRTINGQATTLTGADLNNASPEAITYVHGFNGLPGIFGGMTMEDMKSILVKDGNNMKIKDYKELATFLRTKKNEAGATMVENLAQNSDKYNVVGLTLEAMGMNRDTIQKGGTDKFDDYAKTSRKYLVQFDDYMDKKKYSGVKMDEFRKDIQSYIATGAPSLESLAKRGAFIQGSKEKPGQSNTQNFDWRIEGFLNESKEDKLKLKDSIDKFTTLDDQQKKKLVAAGNILYADTGNAAIEFKEEAGKVYLKTYGEWTPIDVTKDTMPGFSNGEFDIYFDGLMELVNAANFTNYVKKIFRGKHTGEAPKGQEYFARSTLWYNIKTITPFNGLGDLVYTTREGDASKSRYDPRKYGWAASTSDIEVIDAGWFGDLAKTSPTLNTYVGEYASYLNKLGMRHQNTKSDGLPK